MKRKLFLLATLIMVFLLSACSDAGVDSEKEPPDSMPVETIKAEANEMKKMIITVGETKFTATMMNNSSVKALMELLSKKPLTIHMEDYGGFEKFGTLGQKLPRNDERITTTAGDLILYEGHLLVLYYATNSWNFTRLGKIDNATGDELKTALGNGNVTVTLSMGE